MRRRVWIWLLWLAAACCLYFFENGTGTRAVLACSLLLPLVPVVRRGLFAPDLPAPQPQSVVRAHAQPAFSVPHVEAAGDVRRYQPGDPMNRIHWKLSAKRDELLVRDVVLEDTEDPQEGTRVQAEKKENLNTEDKLRPARLQWRHIRCACCAALIALALLLLLLPSARLGAQALANRLFAASEARNAYVYQYFPVPEAQPVLLAAMLLGLIALALATLTLCSGRRALALVLLLGCAGFQMYFGLAFPAWANLTLFTLFMLQLHRRPCTVRNAGIMTAAVLLISLTVLLAWPGEDAATEAASERVRDSLSRIAAQLGGTAAETPAGEDTVRHAHTRTLSEGQQAAQEGRTFRLQQVAEQQISRPEWIDWLRSALLILLFVALLLLPFLPFLLLNARQRRAQAACQSFQSENIAEAVCAIFTQVIRWLEAMGISAGNLLYREWAPTVAEGMTADYAERFAQCAAMFEEATYSDHPLEEGQRTQLLALLEETEEILLARADWKQRLLLRYKECLW